MLLVTGAAGFIGYHFCLKRLSMGESVVGIDNLNDYYDVSLKKARLERLKKHKNFIFQKLDIADGGRLADVFNRFSITRVVNLAAQAGVRYSLKNPMAYIQANCAGFTHVLEQCRRHNVSHLVYASSSSVYGANTRQPFAESDGVDHPVSIYAATKRYNELAAHSYANLYGLASTGLRFFTVYGPWGRPDMAFFKFTRNILKQQAIDVYNHGNLMRDFTYIDDIVEGMSRVLDKPASASDWKNNTINPPNHSFAPYKLYNIGHGQAVKLLDYIGAIEHIIGKKAVLNYLPMQAGDVYSTLADVSSLAEEIGYRPKIEIFEGMTCFVEWFRNYYRI